MIWGKRSRNLFVISPPDLVKKQLVGRPKSFFFQGKGGFQHCA
jgi:hypothetical protein